MSRKIDMPGATQFSDHMAASRPFSTAPMQEHTAGGVYMYPKNTADAALSYAEAEAMAARHMQMPPHIADASPRRAVMHQPQATVSPMPQGYMRTPPASDVAAQAEQQEAAVRAAQAALNTLEAEKALAAKSRIAPAAVPRSAPKASVPAMATVPQAAPTVVSVPPAAGASGVPAALHFCTVTGTSYLFKVVSLYRSLEAYSNNFMLVVCCIDAETQAALEKLHLSRCIAVSVEALGDSGLLALRSERSVSELCWTLKGHFLLWLLTEKGLPEAVYLDSDVAFFSDPKLRGILCQAHLRGGCFAALCMTVIAR